KSRIPERNRAPSEANRTLRNDQNSERSPFAQMHPTPTIRKNAAETDNAPASHTATEDIRCMSTDRKAKASPAITPKCPGSANHPDARITVNGPAPQICDESTTVPG